MKKSIKRIVSLLLTFVIVIASVGCGKTGKEDTAQKDGSQDKVIIGVETYSTTDAEVLEFKKYYMDYLAKDFDVEFIYSEAVSDGDAEISFLESAAAAGAKAIISFYTNDVETMVSTCERLGMYVIIGSGSSTAEEFESVCDNPYFLGSTGPSLDSDYEAGYDMAKHISGLDTDISYVITTGAAAYGMEMHSKRAEGMLDALAEVYGLNYEEDVQTLSHTMDQTDVANDKGIKITILPGFGSDAWNSAMNKLVMSGNYNAVLSVMDPASFSVMVDEAEQANGKDIFVGCVDCFTENELNNFKNVDSTGDIPINFMAGKYGSMVGCAFAAAYNAVAGDAETLRDNGKAFQISQGYWNATSYEEYEELYNLATDTSMIAYSVDDLKAVMPCFDKNADFESFKELAEACSVDDVKARRQ